MEAQSDHNDIRYPLSNSTQPNDLIFKARRSNDQILLDMTRHNNQNQKLKSTAQHLKQKIPAFVLKWWNSNQSKEKMNTFLQQLNNTLKQEIEVLSRKINQFRIQYEVNEADYHEQLNLTEELQREVAQLEQKIQQLRQNSNGFSQLQNLHQSHNTGTQLRCSSVRNDLKMATNLRQHFLCQINSRFANRLEQNRQQDYYNQIEFVVGFLIERKKLIREKLRQIQQQNDKCTKLINAEQEERQIKNQLKKSIIQKRSQLESLSQSLKQAQQQHQLQQAKFKELEQQYCLSEMDRIVERVRGQKERTKALMNKTIGLLNAVQQHPNIPQIEQDIPDY